MTETPEETTEPANDAAPDRPAVPNVRPHAVSGLGHELLNPDAAAQAEAEAPATPSEQVDPDQGSVVVPTGTLEENLAWVAEPDDAAERQIRANVLWAQQTATDPEADHSELAGELHKAVYPEEPADTDPDAADTDAPAPAGGETPPTDDSASAEEDSAATAGDGAGTGEQTGDPDSQA